MTQSFEKFTNLYSLSKTVRFELKPIGKTLENIQKNGLLKEDENRAKSYQKVKKIIDRYHKKFISKVLGECKLPKDLLDEYFGLYKIKQRDQKQQKRFKDVQEDLRELIAKCFTDSPAFKRIDKKELFKEDLPQIAQTEEEKALIDDFKSFTTYFTGFHKNRENMYSSKEQSTAIAYRLIHENLPKFIDNMASFEKAITKLDPKDIEKLYCELSKYVQVKQIAEMFQLEYYNSVLTQEQIDAYNLVIGGKSEKDGKKIQGLNEYINLYNQKEKDKNNRLPKLKPLFKQILSDRNAISWLPEKFKNDKEVLEAIEKCYRELCENVFGPCKEGEHSLHELLISLKDFDLDKIYLRADTSLTDISQKMFGDWRAINRAIIADFERNNPQKPRESDEKYNKRKDDHIKSLKYIPIGYINGCLSQIGEPYNKKVEDYFAQADSGDTAGGQTVSLFVQIDNTYNNVKELLNTSYDENRKLSQDKTSVEKIKALLDSIKSLQWFIKPLLGKGDEADKDERFYGEFSVLWQELDNVTPLYNMVRNYVTQKPYSEEKIKLNFESSYFLSGWVQDYDTKAGLLYEREGLYYLAVNNKKLSDEYKKHLQKDADKDTATRIILDFQKPDNKNIPRLFIRSKGDSFAPAIEKYSLPINKVIKIYDEGMFKTDYRIKNPLDYLKSLHMLIDYFKEGFSKHESYCHYDFQWKETNKYNDIAEFYHDVEVSCYQIKYEKVNWSTLLNYVDEGKIYLFKIYNKDFSPYSKGTPNMHTLYWKMLFDKQNLANVVYKLNGQAEVFYRKKSINKDDKVVHLKNQAIQNKNTLNRKKESTFNYDLIKDRRYTVDKFQFHVPITMNFKAVGTNDINPEVNQFIKDNGVQHIIGIDRGERHLLYLTMIDLEGKIKVQKSLNEIVYKNPKTNDEYRTNYHSLLNTKEKERETARQSWQTIENIKELKEGYLSLVIHEITQLMVENNAIVVLEDLNMGFMRGRQKVEKQVYQKFEKMLIDKLNYLVDKRKSANELGGVLNAYQLTNKFESFKKMGKQNGFLFYIPAWNTSKMDPVTGFVNLFDTRYENIEKAKAFFAKFDSIRYNAQKDWFEFETKNYSQFSAKADGTLQNWTLCTPGPRIETFRNPEKNNQWDSREIELTAQFKDLFKEADLSVDLQSFIGKQTEKSFFERLLYLFKLTLQMRNSHTGTEKDYMISPVADSNGEFYDSRNYENSKNAVLPANADANGAYNIARKGLWVIKQIKEAEDLRKVNLAISNKEWLQFVQQ